jgi:pantoate kinase
MDTDTVLSDPAAVGRIAAAGIRCVDEFINTQTEKMLFSLSAEFSQSAGLETKEVKGALSVLRKDHGASMCMLGNSIFTNASEDEVRDLLGDVRSFSCSSSAEGPKLIRKA